MRWSEGKRGQERETTPRDPPEREREPERERDERCRDETRETGGPPDGTLVASVGLATLAWPFLVVVFLPLA